VDYRGRVISTWLPRFEGTRDLKFSVAEQAAIRNAEAALGYRPQQIPPVRHRVRVLPWLLGGAFAVWFTFSLFLPIAQVVKHGLSSSAFVPNAQRPPSSKPGRELPSDASRRNPQPIPQMMEPFSSNTGDRPEPSSDGHVVCTNVRDVGVAATPPFHDAQNGIQAATSDKRATNRQEAEPASCPEGQSVASIAYVNAPDDHIYRVVHCKPKSQGNARRGTLHTEPGGRVHDPASLQQPREKVELHAADFENSPGSSSVSVEPRWLSFDPSQTEMLSGVWVQDGGSFQNKGRVSPTSGKPSFKKKSLLRRALGGVGRPALGVVRSVGASVRGELWGD